MNCPKCNSSNIFTHKTTVSYNLSNTRFPRIIIPKYECLACRCKFDIKIDRRN